MNHYGWRAPTRGRRVTRVPPRVFCAVGWRSRVLARHHGAQRVRARARGRPSRATREPAASSVHLYSKNEACFAEVQVKQR